jgi:hypothetical protein
MWGMYVCMDTTIKTGSILNTATTATTIFNTREELEGWVERIKTVSASTAKTFVIANNHPDGKAAVSALEIEHLLSGKKVKAPESLIAKYPRLEEFGESEASPKRLQF